jgi:hypothetical protein
MSTMMKRQLIMALTGASLVLLTSGCALIRADNEPEFWVRRHATERIETPAGQEALWESVRLVYGIPELLGCALR